MGEHRGVGKRAQALEIPLADRPDVNEGHIDGHGGLPSFSFDPTERDNVLARADELLGDEVHIQGAMKLVRNRSSTS
jgi:hypothetical protein